MASLLYFFISFVLWPIGHLVLCKPALRMKKTNSSNKFILCLKLKEIAKSQGQEKWTLALWMIFRVSLFATHEDQIYPWLQATWPDDGYYVTFVGKLTRMNTFMSVFGYFYAAVFSKQIGQKQLLIHTYFWEKFE